MNFSELSAYFEKLEKESKRLVLVDILSQLFRQAKAEEIDKICYLIQGRVAPFFEPTEIGMAEKMVADSIGRAFSKPKEDVLKLYRQKGNMGLAALELADRLQTTDHGKKKVVDSGQLTVSEVSAELLKIAKSGGEGAVEKKISTFSELLRKLDSISVKHIVNIPLGTLRLGIGDPTVLDALSIAKKGDKSLRPVLEDAYNKTSDLGFVAKTFLQKGEGGVKEMRLIIGKPIRSALAERLPSAEEVIKRVGNNFAAEHKLDGFRVQVHKNGKDVQLFSRNLENTTHAFPDLVKAVKEEIRAKSAIIDCEAIAYNPQTQEFLPFQETSKRRRKYKIEEMVQKLPLVMFAFDLLLVNGKDITGKSFEERRKELEKIIPKNSQIVRRTEERILHSAGEITEFFNEAISEGLEGLMIKKLDSPYQAGGRGFHWIKFKRVSAGELTDTIDCVLLGIYGGRGKRTEFGVGGLLVGVYDEKNDEFVTISKVGTGLTDEEFRRVNEIGLKLKVERKPARVNAKIEPSYWVEPKVVLEVFADEITRSPIHTAGARNGELGYALRFPRLVSFRSTDKRAEDATTVKEVEEMYSTQYKKGKKK